jgi:putative membrane protein insertion efficiency factor
MRKFTAAVIRLYQRTLSGDHGWFQRLFPYGVCRFYPTCSEYTRQAVLKYGVMMGLLKGLQRILRCHPWGGSGNDPVK